MPIALYDHPVSAPCRAVKMTAEHLGIKLVLKFVDLFAGEQLKPEFLAINPQHAVPTIDDDGFILWESRAIMAYLVNKYAPDSPLYPKDPKARAVVDKMLQFDLGVIYQTSAICVRSIVFRNRPVPPEDEKNMKKSLASFEKILGTTPFAAGNHLTIADYSIFSNLTLVEEFFGNTLEDYPKISAWYQRLKMESPKYKEINEIPVKQFKEYAKKEEINDEGVDDASSYEKNIYKDFSLVLHTVKPCDSILNKCNKI